MLISPFLLGFRFTGKTIEMRENGLFKVQSTLNFRSIKLLDKTFGLFQLPEKVFAGEGEEKKHNFTITNDEGIRFTQECNVSILLHFYSRNKRRAFLQIIPYRNQLSVRLYAQYSSPVRYVRSHYTFS